MLPDQPSTFRRPTAEELPWWWRLEDASGTEVESADHSGERFATQGDAESWVGEIYAELADAGIDAVRLFEHDREVYGPMSLHAEG